MLATGRLWNRPIYWQIHSAYFQREHPLVTRVLNVQQAVTIYLWVPHQSSVPLASPILCEFAFAVVLKNWLFTATLDIVPGVYLETFARSPPAPPPGMCRQLAQVWNHFSLICYSFKMTICQLRSMKSPWNGWSLCVFAISHMLPSP